MSIKRIIIIVLSIIALIVAGYWIVADNFSHEPIIAFLLGVVGLIGQIFIDKKDDTSVKENKNKVKTKSGNQTTNVTVTIGDNLKPISNPEENAQKQITPNNREERLQILKNKVGVLFIDDKQFNIVKILKTAGWKKTKSVLDIKSLDETKVKEALIYFVDINGVGKLLECPAEGLDIALMLKQKYPTRKVVIYSANPKNEVFHEAWEQCDHKLIKNALPYEYQGLVENFSLELQDAGIV